MESQLTEGRFSLRALAPQKPARLELRLGGGEPETGELCVGPEFAYLNVGDIFRADPTSRQLRVLYRRRSRHNTLFFTERCNSRCLMCSQPPRDIDDSRLVDDLLQIIPWMDPETRELGITGGEPTLLSDRLIAILAATKHHLPNTAVHMLTNGRLLKHLRYAEEIASVDHPDLMLGVPLYADHAALHDFVVQSSGAFEETNWGLLNLGRVGVAIELRIVIHQHTYRRLPQFARYVARNLPFVSQVALMGLELMGYARSNREALWVDPVEYQDQLEEAVSILEYAGIQALVYNHQLCVLRPSLHRLARKSISDWKNIYMPECDGCTRKAECGGFFASAHLQYSKNIRPFNDSIPLGPLTHVG